MPIRVEGLKELRSALRDAKLASPKEITTALAGGAREVTNRARTLAPKGGPNAGKMGSTLRPFSNQRAAGVMTSHPGAPVQEFATVYNRRPRGSGGQAISAATKSHIRKGHMTASDAGLEQVHMVNVMPRGPSGGRFMYKAIDQLGVGLQDEAFDALVEILKCHDWFVQ